MLLCAHLEIDLAARRGGAVGQTARRIDGEAQPVVAGARALRRFAARHRVLHKARHLQLAQTHTVRQTDNNLKSCELTLGMILRSCDSTHPVHVSSAAGEPARASTRTNA